MHSVGWRRDLGHCRSREGHAKVSLQRGSHALLRSNRKLLHLQTMPHAIDPAFLDHVMAGQAAITTAGLMFTSAALGVLTGRKTAPERPFPDSTQSGISEGKAKYIGGKDQSTVGQFTDTIPEDAADLKSVSDTAIQQMLPSSSSALLESSSSHSNLQSSLPFNRAQIEKIETLAAAQKAEGELDAKGSLSDSTNKSSRLLSAEQLWKDAWKAFEQPEQKHGLVASRKLSGLPMREQRSDFEHQNSFPSLTARLFGRRDRSRPQEQRQGVQAQGNLQRRTLKPDEDVWAKPQLALQGIAPAARVRLLACALAALEKQISALPDALSTASPEQWRLATQAITASCAVTSAHAWLGYIPESLVQDAQEVLQQLAAHDSLAGSSEQPAGASTCSSFGQLLTKAMPSEVQPPAKSSGQPGKSRNKVSLAEPKEISSLEALQIEQARIHGTLVSYLRCGWQSVNSSQPDTTESRCKTSGSDSATSLTSIEGSNQRDAHVSDEGAERGNVPVAQRQQQKQMSMARASPQLESPHAASKMQQSESKETMRQLSRREEAMAALEGKRQTTSPRSAAKGQGGTAQQMPMVVRCGAAVLQDLTVSVADAAADAYLAEAGVSRESRTLTSRGPDSAADAWLLVLHPRLTTTRSLERFRNQVAMQRWMEANFGSVATMYEDRHQLWGFNHKGRLLQRSLPARRAQELGRLTGLRYYYSTALESIDFLAPLLERLFSKIGDAVSWLLVRLIGRSLGLIYRGVRESLVPRQRPTVPRKGNQHRWAPF